MKTFEEIKEHWIGKAVAIAFIVSSTTWGVAHKVMVEPRNFIIEQQKSDIRDFKDRIKELESAKERLASLLEKKPKEDTPPKPAAPETDRPKDKTDPESENSRLMSEKSEIKSENSKLIAEKSRLEAENKRLSGENQALKQKTARLSEERRKSLLAKIEAVEAKKQSLYQKIQEESKRLNALLIAKSDLAGQKEKEIAFLKSQIKSMEDQILGLQSQL